MFALLSEMLKSKDYSKWDCLTDSLPGKNCTGCNPMKEDFCMCYV